MNTMRSISLTALGTRETARRIQKLSAGPTDRSDEQRIVGLLRGLPLEERGEAVRLVEGSAQRRSPTWSLVDEFSSDDLRSEARELVEVARPHAASTGRVVISDIDDTIRPEHDPSSTKTEAYPGARSFYQALDAGPQGLDIAGDVHFVTARDGFFRRGEELIEKAGIDYGSVSHGTVLSGALVLLGQFELAVKEKVEDIERLLVRNPSRQVVLIGDTVQADPTIFRKVLASHEGRIEAVFVHEVEGRPCPPGLASHPAVIVFRDFADAAEQAAARGLISEGQLTEILATM